ncbi:hypothetical protein A33M_4437 [Rhodovulum sp. PH10]|nr:hypothetical protein A33M_4437 [Rhodovulum sp. PH10]
MRLEGRGHGAGLILRDGRFAAPQDEVIVSRRWYETRASSFETLAEPAFGPRELGSGPRDEIMISRRLSV